MNFSNKDFLLLLGILVAVIVTLTTLVYHEGTEAQNETSKSAIKPTTSLVPPTGLIKKAIERIELKSLIR